MEKFNTVARITLAKQEEDPLAGLAIDQLRAEGLKYAANQCGISEGQEVHVFERAAILASETSSRKVDLSFLPDDERVFVARENGGKWYDRYRLAGLLWFVAAVNALMAAVQGMDETVINGAQIFFLGQLGIEEMPAIKGLVIGGPYLCCAVLGCWMSSPINKWFGRRGAIAFAAFVTLLSCVGQACTNTWQTMLIARFVLGIGIGIASSTVPVYAAETAPPSARGAIVMLWQFWTAAGIMIGNATGIAFYQIPDKAGITGLNWRLMMGSPAVLALVVLLLVFRCPESPAWFMCEDFGLPASWSWFPQPKRGHAAAYRAMCRLRKSNVQAARDCYKGYLQQQVEARAGRAQSGWRSWFEPVKGRRNQRAFWATQTVMIMQQLCGVNVIAYFSTPILKSAGFTNTSALSFSLGLGAINFLFAIPAIFTIDTFGRRSLLLATLPALAACLFVTGGSFRLPEGPTRNNITISFLFLFMAAYSPGAGPVPFTYCGEAWPLYIRSLGMAINTATTWGFNFAIAMSFPKLVAGAGQAGSFFLYAGFCVALWFMVWFLVPETRMVSLEELDKVFSESTAAFVGGNARVLLRRKECTFCEERGVAVNAPEGFEASPPRTSSIGKKSVAGTSSGYDGSVERVRTPEGPPPSRELEPGVLLTYVPASDEGRRLTQGCTGAVV